MLGIGRDPEQRLRGDVVQRHIGDRRQTHECARKEVGQCQPTPTHPQLHAGQHLP
jgi:hypothetical protein